MSQATQDWRARYAFGLPAGSVRALLALIIFGAIWAWLLLKPDSEVPDYLQNLLFVIMGHYFAARHVADREGDIGPPPLFFPVGTVRLILIGGFIVVAVLLFQQDRVWIGPQAEKLHQGVLTLLLVGGFLLGVAIARLWALFAKGRPLPRWLEDLRAVVSLAAVALLVLLAFNLIEVPDWDMLRAVRQLAGGSGLNGALAAIVGFYFGSRS